MRRSFPVLASILLVGCQSQAQREEQKYEIVAGGTDAKAKCEQGRKVAAAYLDANNEGEYRRWKLRSDIDCTTASLDQDNRSLYGEDLTNVPDNTTDPAP